MKVKGYDEKGNPMWVPDNYQEVKETIEKEEAKVKVSEDKPKPKKKIKKK